MKPFSYYTSTFLTCYNAKKRVKLIRKRIVAMTEKVRTFIRHSSFLRGALRIIDIAGNIDRDAIRKEIHTTNNPRDAIARDWQNVGNDIRKAIYKYKNEAIATK